MRPGHLYAYTSSIHTSQLHINHHIPNSKTCIWEACLVLLPGTLPGYRLTVKLFKSVAAQQPTRLPRQALPFYTWTLWSFSGTSFAPQSQPLYGSLQMNIDEHGISLRSAHLQLANNHR